VITISSSRVQYGKYNDRLYLIDYHLDDEPEKIVTELGKLREKYGYSKIFCKVPDFAMPVFLQAGFTVEAFVPRFYRNMNGCFFMSRFYNGRDMILNEEKEYFEALATVIRSVEPIPVFPMKPDMVIRPFAAEENGIIASHLGSIFRSYPFPVSDPDFIAQTMDEGTVYFGAYVEEKLAGVTSAEFYTENGAAEMTDFAVLPEYRGQKVAQSLLFFMEDWVKNTSEITTLYTIARLRETGMNVVFKRGNYSFCGTLVNNTRIGSGIESMNVFYKHLDR
ncbi:MAG: putative beta-lysine N-acetyltransferase, partial [Spirochaetota bacterium]